MKMDANIKEAFMGVMNSSREIIKNEQKHLYPNMLDLLSRTTKTYVDTTQKLDRFSDDIVLFWMEKILPLAFDSDTTTVQKNAIIALELAIKRIDLTDLQDSNPKEYEKIKKTLLNDYPKQLHLIRNAVNSNWYKIWCILAKVSEKILIATASSINTYLAIVESAFRSSNLHIRAEAFYCWRTLTEIFVKYNELRSQKRIKLLCIPLKTSHCKTLTSAANKIHTWWYLISHMGDQLEAYNDLLFKTFLFSSFGDFDSTASNAISLFPQTAKILSLTLLLGFGIMTDEIADEVKITSLEMHEKAIFSDNLVKLNWKILLNAVFQSSESFKENFPNSIDFIWTAIWSKFLKIADAFDFIFSFLESSPKKFDKVIYRSLILDLTSELPMDLGEIWKVNFEFIKTQSELGIDLQVIEKLCGFPVTSESLATFQEVILQVSENDTNYIRNTKVCFWKSMTHSYLNNIDDLKLPIEWEVFPVKNSKDGDPISPVWVELLTTFEKDKLEDLASVFLKTIEDKENGSSIEIYIQELFKVPNSLCLKDSIGLLSVSSNCNSMVEYLAKSLTSFEPENMSDSELENVKAVCSKVGKLKKEKKVNEKNFTAFKRNILKCFSKHARLSDIKEGLTIKDNDFVIIPTVWSLNPEKLTEHQKEKIGNKARDIPALYNDMSQSEDGANFKAWTPKKLVLAHEIVIEGKDSEEEQSEKESQERDKSPPRNVQAEKLTFATPSQPLAPPSTPITSSAKSKQSKQFTGRGAQLMNILRSKQGNNHQASSPAAVAAASPNTVEKDSSMCASPVVNRKANRFNSPRNLGAPAPPDTPSSILKRKFMDCSFADQTPEQQAKKKRVSFHDPPVSATKEFVTEAVENNNNIDDCSSPKVLGSGKHSLKRKSRLDSMKEITSLENTEIAPTQQTVVTTTQPDLEKLTFNSEEEALEHILKKYTCEELLELKIKQQSVAKTSEIVQTPTTATTLINLIRKFIETEGDSFKKIFLENLSEKYSKEFLVCATQENLCADVCKQLNFESILDFVSNHIKTEKSSAVLAKILNQLQTILERNEEEFRDVSKEHLEHMLKTTRLSNNEAFQFIQLIAAKEKVMDTN